MAIVQREVLEPARQVCGICFSNDEIGSNINGTHSVAWCAQYFTGKQEQRQVIAWLKSFMEKTKWPNKTSYERLEEIWSGKRKTWAENS